MNNKIQENAMKNPAKTARSHFGKAPTFIAVRGRRDGESLVSVLAVCAFGGLLLAALLAVPGGLRWYNAQELSVSVRHPPTWSPLTAIKTQRSPESPETPQHPDSADHSESSEVAGFLDALAEVSYRANSWFGHDDLGRSLFFRIWPGFLVSLAIGLSAATIALVFGGAWGSISALIGGRVDVVMMRIVDILYGLPYILMVILMQIALQRPLTALLGGERKHADVVILFVAIGSVSWLTMARVVRGQVLSLRQRPFVEASRLAGAGPSWILRRHLLPNLIGPMLTYAALVVPQAVMQEAFLSFLGLGIQQPMPSLGRLAADGVESMNAFVDFWWLLVIPCAFLVLTLLSLNFMGDALRDMLDPKSKQVSWV